MNNYTSHKKQYLQINGFTSIFVLLFILVLSLAVASNPKDNYKDFSIIKLSDTKKQSEIHNIISTIKNELNDSDDVPEIELEKVNQELSKHILRSDTNFFIKNIVTGKKTKVDAKGLDKISKVIIYRPNRSTLVKKYILTGGIATDKRLTFEINSRAYDTYFDFPKDLSVVVVYVK